MKPHLGKLMAVRGCWEEEVMVIRNVATGGVILQWRPLYRVLQDVMFKPVDWKTEGKTKRPESDLWSWSKKVEREFPRVESLREYGQIGVISMFQIRV